MDVMVLSLVFLRQDAVMLRKLFWLNSLGYLWRFMAPFVINMGRF